MPQSTTPPAAAASSRGAVVRALPIRFDDEELVRALAQGNPAAAREIWDRYSGLVRGLLRRSLGLSAEVDDAVQEAFLRVYRCIGSLRDSSRLRSFVVGVTIRVAREQLRFRRVRRWLRLTDDGDLPEVESDGTDHEAAEALSRLYGMLDRIDTETRLVFVLRFVEQIPTREIAEVLDCSLATAKRRVARAEKRIHRAAADDPALARFTSEWGDDE